MEPTVPPFRPLPKRPPLRVATRAHARLPAKRLAPLLFLAQPLLALLLLEGFSRGDPAEVWQWLSARPLVFLLNFALFLGLFLLPSALPGRAAPSCRVLLAALSGGLGFAAFYKARYRFEPLLLTDILQLGSARAALQGFSMRIGWLPLAYLLVGAGLALACCLRLSRRGPSLRRRLLSALAGALLLCLCLPLCGFDRPYVEPRTDLLGYARNEGGLFTAIAAERLRRSARYAGYTPGDAEAAYREAQVLTAPDAAQTPNIILILSESFIGQAELSPYLDFTDTLMPFYEALLRESVSGRVYVPKQGGGTSETEFEVLTGLGSQYAVNPYSAGLPELNSLAAVLRERGYRTTALHWYTGVFYNRYRNLYQLGFDEFHTTDTSAVPHEKIGAYVSDAAHYRSALEQLRRTPERDFIFCITMQNHFPYDPGEAAGAEGAAVPFTNALSEGNARIAAGYFALLRESDSALRELVRELTALEEPTLLVFFGDHIPPLGDSFYAEIGMPVETEVGHLAPYFIWSNTGSLTPEKADMQAWQLGAFALSKAGITSDPFFSLTEALRLSGADRDDRYDLLAYDAHFGDQAAYRLAGFQIPSPDWQIGGEMRLLGVDAAEIDGWVYLLPRVADRRQAIRLSVNGLPMDNWCVRPSEEPVTLQCVLTNSRGAVYNQSNAITFASTAELLAQAGEPQRLALPLDGETFTVSRETRDYLVAQTRRGFSAQAASLSVGGERMEYQPAYALTRAGRFHVPLKSAFASPQPLTLVISKAELAGYELTGEGVGQYLRDRGAVLTLLGEYTLTASAS